MKKQYKDKISAQFRKSVEGTITRIANNDPVNRPFHSALLSDDVIFWSAFERSFSTSFGQAAVEEIVYFTALANGADEAERQKETMVTLDKAYVQAVDNHITKLRGNQLTDYSWVKTLKDIRNVTPSGDTTTFRVISDVWWKKDGVDHFISCKTVKPNLDQTAEAKKDCLHLALALPESKTYFGLWYNPFGEKRDDYKHNFPMKIFDFKKDTDVVLIGKEMWDTIGGQGCYEELLALATEVGKDTKESISKIQK